MKLHVEGRYLKDNLGNIVVLRGVNKNGFEDGGGGFWAGFLGWSSGNAQLELNAMKRWGVNVVRMHQSVDHWKFNMDNHRQVIKELLSLAAERGLYIIYDFYSVTDYFAGGQQDPMPFPPYQTSQNASSVIANEDEFVDVWTSIATELRDYPNVIFEIWNEPWSQVAVTKEQLWGDWHRVWQKCINAIRATGATQLIIIQLDYGIWANLISYSGRKMTDYVNEQYAFNDPLGNLVYSFHLFRGDFSKEGVNVWTYDDIKLGLQICAVDYVFSILNKPVFCGEFGANWWWKLENPEEFQRELDWFTNLLTIFNEWKLNYAAFWWHTAGQYSLIEDWGGTPRESGKILIQKIAEAIPTPIPPIQAVANILSPFAIGIIMLALSRRR